eukprot:4396409-Alexandrium_andersonii.AAC.1
MGQRGLRDHLGPQLLRRPRAEIDQRRLIARLEQDLAAAPQFVDTGHSLAHSALARSASAQDWACQDRPRGTILKRQD